MNSSKKVPVYVTFEEDKFEELKLISEAKGLRPSQFIRTQIISIVNRAKTKP